MRTTSNWCGVSLCRDLLGPPYGNAYGHYRHALKGMESINLSKPILTGGLSMAREILLFATFLLTTFH